jgi:PAS domain S-box-containing protein
VRNLFALQPTGAARAEHPRVLGWFGTTALAMGGSNQSLFLIGALVLSQGTGAIPLLVVGLLLSWAALPGWTELILMWPNRVGGIAATCAEAFRPYSPVLANLTGFCYWWGWVPTCGLTAILSATALHEWYLPAVPVKLLATVIVLVFMTVNLCGVRWATRVAAPIAVCSAALAFLSAIIPVAFGQVSWTQAASFHLQAPFHGVFGNLTSAMAGLYLIGFAAPAFEAAACHVGEMRNPEREAPRAMFAAAGMASLYFIVLPVVWLGVIGRHGLGGELMLTLGPTFAPLVGAAAKSFAIWFMVLNMFHGTLQPLAGASRTLSQLSEDGLLPRLLARRNLNDAPVVATALTAVMSIAFLMTGDPTWVIAAANLTYLIGIGLPSVAVWLLRRNHPGMHRPYRAPRGTIVLGVGAAGAWLLSTVLGFEQFGLPTVLAGLALAYSGSALYAWRVWSDRRAAGTTAERPRRGLHLKLTGSMLLVLTLDGGGYLLAISHVKADAPLVTLLEDIFVAVALLTISVGLILPGMIAHATRQVADAAAKLATGTLAELTRAMQALARGELEAAHAKVDFDPVVVYSHDEVAQMATSFNTMQEEAARAAIALDGAREGLRTSVEDLRQSRELYRAIVENSTSLIALLDLEGRILYASPSLDGAVGYERGGLATRRLAALADEQDRGGIEAVIASADEGALPVARLLRGDGGSILVEGTSAAIRDAGGRTEMLLVVFQDVTARRADEEKRLRLEEQLRQSQKMEAVGTLAGGVAHDFNNILMAISGRTEMLLGALDADDPRRTDAEEVYRAADRAATLTKQLLAFSRRQILQPKVIDLGNVVTGLAPMLHRLLGEDVEFVTVLAPTRGAVLADPSQLEQVVLNLAVNARHAMPAGGRITVEVSDDGGNVVLSVSDTGCGMDEATQAQVFEPFFTTKEPGMGTGLGLSMVYGIVEQSGGTISIESAPDAGATFRVAFPRVDRPAVVSPEPVAAPETPVGSESVLLVEDDEIVRKLVAEMVAQQGYTVTTASNPGQAVELCKAPGASFDVMISDVVMPQMNGPQLAELLAPILPEMSVIFVSGYPSDAIVSRGGAAIDGFLQKPFSASQLAEKLREVLDAPVVRAA